MPVAHHCYLLFWNKSCRKLLGRFDYYLSMTIPGFIGGSAIFVMRDAKRHFIISAFSGSVSNHKFSILSLLRHIPSLKNLHNLQLLETLVHHWTPLKKRRYYLKTETLLFMLVNGAFLYFMRLWKTKKSDQVMPEIWYSRCLQRIALATVLTDF